MQAPKNGFFYVLDRATGELISAEQIVPINWATGHRQGDRAADREPGGALRHRPR
jgi:glucose dehydrogenase